MRKLIFAVMVLLMVLPLASAAVVNEKVHLSRIRLGEYGYVSGCQMDSYVYVYNDNSGSSVRDGKLSVRLMDDSVYDSASGIKIKAREGHSQSFWTDLDGTPKGEYLAKVTFTAADGVRKTKYRYVYID